MEEAIPPLSIDIRWFNVLFPLHLRIGPDGEIREAGTTMSRLLATVQTSDFFEIFTINKPRNITDYDGVFGRAGKKLTITAQFGQSQQLQFRGVACPMSGTRELLVDLAIGNDLAEAIQRFGLTAKDFRPNDFSVDLFYTFETQKALLEDSQTLASALSTAKEEAEQLANVDHVTGIANRRALRQYLEDLVASGTDEEYALLHIDLDKFKSVNDAFGHAAGDAVLQHTAESLTATETAEVFPARLGGDEFAVILRAPSEDDVLIGHAAKLVERISRTIRHGEHLCTVGASIGIARFRPAKLETPEQPLVESDIALYAAKDMNDPVVLLTPDMVAEHTRTTELIQEIQIGISELQFIPYFQPQIDLKTGVVSGVEVLARWKNPTRGILPPASWLNAAESAGLMPAIDRVVLMKAIATFRDWRRTLAAPLKLSFNLTAANLRSTEFVETVEDELLLAGISNSCVQIELLESILFDQIDSALVERCNRLVASGFTLALDDFGTGHASISTLIEAPISVLKIDRSFVTGLDQKPKLQRITKSIIAMSDQLGLCVVAEGVETIQDLTQIAAYGCDFAQGYYFSPPLAADLCKQWIDGFTPNNLATIPA